MRPELTEEEAIRRILQQGGFADYVDVANAVQQQFGLKVGAARVEKVAIALREQGDTTPSAKLGTSDIRLTAKRQQSTGSPKAAVESQQVTAGIDGERRSTILQFVESMGGFDAARSAINEVEASLKHLMQHE